jgi:hypothetical protein
VIGSKEGLSIQRYSVIKRLLGFMRFAQDRAEQHLLWIVQKLVLQKYILYSQRTTIDARLHPPQAVGLQQGGSYSAQPAEGRAVETVHSRLLCDIENIKSSIASTKRKTALPSLLEKLRKRMISATTE